MDTITINGVGVKLPLTLDDAYSLEATFTECNPDNYSEILKAMCLIFAYHGVCNPMRSLSELASIHFGIV
jgi:hypothetical protein